MTYITMIKDLCTGDLIQTFITSLAASGGGDTPEAVLDGLYDSVYKINWRTGSTKYLFHIADAPPHGRIYSRGDDGFPDGCPCRITIEKISDGLKE
jgi:hypothetical protein